MNLCALSALQPAAQTIAARSAQPLPSAQQLRTQLPLRSVLAEQVRQQRQAINQVLRGEDPRLLVVLGPCSLHDPVAALEYADRLAELNDQVADRLLLVMRAYVEKPRTTVGWKGMVYDPHLDGRNDLNEGLQASRRLLLALLERGLPLASELLQPLLAGYFEDLLSWAAIGARTSESQIHRELVSGLEIPVGFKNGTDGSLSIACDAMQAAAHPHQHFGVNAEGRPALVQTRGNSQTHLVLRGGRTGPNYDPASVQQACQALAKQGLNSALMVDCSHANSHKNPKLQPQVLESVVAQRLAGQHQLRAVMLESHLHEGSQPLSEDLRYGVSITDGCLGWDETQALLLKAYASL